MSGSFQGFHWMVGALEAAIVLSAFAGVEQQPSSQADRDAKVAPRRAAGENENRGAAPATREQQPQDPQQRITTRKVVVPAEQARNTDKFLATCLAFSNEEEIAMAKLALEHSKTDRVREFAEMMIKDHSELLEGLQKFGPQKAGLVSTAGRAGNAGAARTNAQARNAGAAPANGQAGNAGARPALPDTGAAGQARQGSGFDFVSLKREIGQQCLKSAAKMWQEKEPAEADMAYLGQQVVLHQMMIDHGTVFREHASDDLRMAIDEGIEKAQQHKKHATSLIEELAREDHATGSGRTDSRQN